MQPVEGVIGNRWPRGFYRVYAETAAIAPTSLAVLGVFRWSELKNIATILRVWTRVTVVTAVTAQRMDPLLLYFARGYTARDATGATSVAINAGQAKLRTGMSDSLLVAAPSGNIDVASGAAGVSGGTKTLDANPMGDKGFGQEIVGALGTVMEGDIFSLPPQGAHPPVLQAQAPGGGEGIVLRWGGSTLATGTVTVGFGIEWAESAVS